MLKKLLAQTRLHPLQRRLQKEPFYRFKSFEELQLAASWGFRIDANTASVDDWLRLPGLSIHQARQLTKLTANQLFFNCIEDVAAVLNIPVQQIYPWAAVLQFCYYDTEHALEPVAINVNTATAAELTTVPAIDPFLARAIVHYRQGGNYRDLCDLQQRLRLNTQVAAELLHYLSF
ncbi:MAG: ComEA family DNA-binding protein [Cyanobacteria bacterium P01_D01_bin.105]